MSLNSEQKKSSLKPTRAFEESDAQTTQEAISSEHSDEAVTRALEMYLRQRALVSPTDLPRWVTW